MTDRKEKLAALYFGLAISALALFWFLTPSYLASVRGAAVGGFIALFGVVLMALPVLRVGPYQWISDLYFEDIMKRDGLKSPETDQERERREDRRKTDLVFQQIFGPYLIGIGTFVNGISGFFDSPS